MSNWRLAAVLILAVVLLGILAATARAQGAWVHGLIDADNRAGYKVRLERWVGVWERRGWSRTNTGGAWGIGAPMAGRYRVRLEEMPAGAKMIGARYPGGIDGQMSLANRSVEFSVPAAGLVGDIVFIIASAPTATPIMPTIVPTNTPIVLLTATAWPTLPVPTTLYPPTVETTATATATPTAAPCLSFQQFTWAERRSVIATAAMHIGRPLEDKLDWDHDLTLLHGLRDMMLGAPLTRRFEVTIGGVTLTARGFCQAIIVMRPIARGECQDYGVIGWDGTQNWEANGAVTPMSVSASLGE